MPNQTITRWECPVCPYLGRGQHGRVVNVGDAITCPGVPVERTYVAADTVLSDKFAEAVWHGHITSSESGMVDAQRDGLHRAMQRTFGVVTSSRKEASDER